MSIIRIEKDVRFKGGTGVPSMPYYYEDIVTSVYLFGLRLYSYTKKTNLREIEWEDPQKRIIDTTGMPLSVRESLSHNK